MSPKLQGLVRPTHLLFDQLGCDISSVSKVAFLEHIEKRHFKLARPHPLAGGLVQVGRALADQITRATGASEVRQNSHLHRADQIRAVPRTHGTTPLP